MSKNRNLASIMTTDGTSINASSIDAVSLDSADALPLIIDRVDHKTYSYNGTLAVSTGSTRLYMTRSGTLGTFDMFASTAPVGADLTVTINKNGSSIGTGSISDGASSGTAQTLSSTGFSSGDYLTVDITQVGSTTAGEDLYINFRIAG